MTGSGLELTHSFAHWRLARIHRARGDRTSAPEHAAAFLKAFRRADPELVGVAEEARRYAAETFDALVPWTIPAPAK
jgi:hypothetical protein